MSVIVEGLTKVYDGINAIEDVSFDVRKGEILGFLGSNGAGKTTTMKILSCYIPQSSGKAMISGFDVEESPHEVKKRIGYLPEHNPLYSHMYIPEFLDFVAGLHGITNKKERVAKIIQTTGLTSEINKKISELSKGYKQRVGLAQAMIHDPEVLILDEPTSGLDPTQLREMRNLIRKLGEEKTVIFSSHIMQEIEAVCDKVIIIHKGQIKLNERIDKLSESDKNNEWIIRYKKPVAIKSIREIPSISSVSKVERNGFLVSGMDDEKIKKDLFDLAAKEDNYISELHPLKKNLEELFLKYTED